jgi:glycosyl transferase, family 25
MPISSVRTESHNTTLTLVINLARSPDRLEHMHQQLKATQLIWERFEAVEGAKLALPDETLVDPTEYGRRHGKTYAPGELGCYLSHYYAYQHFLGTDKQFALILEDDVKLHPQLEAVLDSLYACAQEWDLVKLSGVHRAGPIQVLRLAAQTSLCVALTRCTGSSAYIINRHAAERLVAGLLPMKIPFDHEFDRAWHYGFKLRVALPWPCGHDQENVSLINTGAAPRRKFSWYKRFSAHAWRFSNEFRRVSYGLAHALSARSSHTK